MNIKSVFRYLDIEKCHFLFFFLVAKDGFLLEQERLRKRTSKKVLNQLGEPPMVQSKLRSRSHTKSKHTAE